MTTHKYFPMRTKADTCRCGEGEDMPVHKHMEHTPGPWTVAQNGFWYGVNLTVDQDTDVRDANARLIAAAPDLLEACKVALLAFSPNHAPDHHHQIQRAIAKAQ